MGSIQEGVDTMESKSEIGPKLVVEQSTQPTQGDNSITPKPSY
jgi:hypothetical protein